MAARDVVVPLAELAAERGDATLITYGLGSCVAIMLLDPGAKVGGMAHVLLPSASLSRSGGRPAKFPETAIPELLRRMQKLGAERPRIVAKLAGGASMFHGLLESGGMPMGDRNVFACRAALRESGLPVLAEMTGGFQGRSVWLNVSTGRVLVRRVGEPDAHI